VLSEAEASEASLLKRANLSVAELRLLILGG